MGINKREEGKKVNVELPKADSAKIMEDANKEDAVIVAVTRDGRIFLGADQVTADDIGPKIAAKLENKTSKEVFLRADVRANYGKVMDAVDGVRSAGVSELGLITEQRDQTVPVK